MLALTEPAAEAISALTQSQQDEQQQGGGLRLALTGESDDLQLTLAVSTEPESGDQVMGTEDGARVFMESRAAEFLDDKVLDVQQDEQGQLNFAVYAQEQQSQG
ncbi:iron-sulfur cluster biosynthesis family protein [Haloechinothrix halophila]|uniref:iron-sulfur cluster biosynthesis family protein n=1 Tax=Haloechinothrix halophila TaxID=1069073 RepID=UPI000414A6EF|nr:iron-sulfur cluster biosynthesis family protein [Haloechinothrix halophila]